MVRSCLYVNIDRYADKVTIGRINGSRHRRADSGIDLSEDIDIAPAQLFLLSAYDQDGVSRLRDLYGGYLTTRSEKTSDAAERARLLRDLSHTLASKRTHHAWRAFCVAESPEALVQGLSELPKPTRIKSEPRLAWVFTGQGAQWPAMGTELMNYPVFQQSILAADRYLNDLGSTWSLSCKSSLLPQEHRNHILTTSRRTVEERPLLAY